MNLRTRRASLASLISVVLLALLVGGMTQAAAPPEVSFVQEGPSQWRMKLKRPGPPRRRFPSSWRGRGSSG